MVDPTASWGWSRQVQRGTINHINPISATRMRPVPTPTRNNPTSGMSEPRKVWSVSARKSASTLFEVIERWARFLSMPWEARVGAWGIWDPTYWDLSHPIRLAKRIKLWTFMLAAIHEQTRGKSRNHLPPWIANPADTTISAMETQNIKIMSRCGSIVRHSLSVACQSNKTMSVYAGSDPP